MALEDQSKLLNPAYWSMMTLRHIKEYQTPAATLTSNIGKGRTDLFQGSSIVLPFNEEVVSRDRGALGSQLTFEEGKGDKNFLNIDKNEVVTMKIIEEVISSFTREHVYENTHYFATELKNSKEKAILKTIKTDAKKLHKVKEINAETVKDILLSADEIMSDHHFPSSGRFVIINNKAHRLIREWLTTIPFQKADQVLSNGIIGNLFGINIAVSSFTDTILFGHQKGLVHADALSAYKIDYDINVNSTKVLGQLVYGVASTFEGKLLGKVTVG